MYNRPVIAGAGMKGKKMKKYLKVVDFETREVVHKVEITNTHQSHIERVMLGMMHNMDTDKFFIDDSDFD